MILFPAIDIRGGNCVRLIQGDYDQETIYGDSPTAMALERENKGAEYIHLIDLDGAKTGNSLNKKANKAVDAALSILVKVCRGNISMAIIKYYLEDVENTLMIG